MGDFSSLDCAGLSPRNLTEPLHKPSTRSIPPTPLVQSVHIHLCEYQYVCIAYISWSRLLHAAASQVVDTTLNHQVAGLDLPWTRRLRHDRETMMRV